MYYAYKSQEQRTPIRSPSYLLKFTHPARILITPHPSTPICCYFHRTEVQSKDASASSVETSFSTPKSSFVRSFSPLQLLSPYLPQNSIITPISCPHIGQRRSYSASEIWTYSVCLPVRRPQVERNSSAVNSSTVARTNFPFSVKCGFFAMARMTGPTFFF